MKRVEVVVNNVNSDTSGGAKRGKFVAEQNGEDPQSDSSVSCFQTRLPIELVEMILYLVLETDFKSALNARAVCHEWNHLIRDKLVYSGTLTDKSVSSFVSLDPSIVLKSLALGKLVMTRIARLPAFRGTTNRKDTYNPALFQRSVKHLIIGGDAGTMLKMYNGNVPLPYSLSSGFAEDHEKLVRVSESVSGADLMNIIPHLKDVETLTISSIGFLSVPLMILKKLDFQHFNNITKLDICVGKKTEGSKICLFLKKAEFPHLSDLYFRIYHSRVHFKICISVFLFLSKHRHVLKRLSLSQAQGYYVVSFAEFTDAALQVETYPNLRYQLMEMKLDYLRLDCFVCNQYFLTNNSWFHLEPDFIKSQRHLRSLELQVLLRSSNYILGELLPACEDTLERLEVTASYYQPNVFNCSTISKFKKLELCHIYQRNTPSTPRCLTSDKLENICELPCSILSLHLAQLPKISELKVLRRKLINLERISYDCNDQPTRMKSVDFFYFVLEHLKFPVLTELRMYHFSCKQVMNVLNRHDGIICFNDENDCITVLVDRLEFNSNEKMEYFSD